MEKHEKEYIKKMKYIAGLCECCFNIPFELIIAQSALESTWGESDKAKKLNNYFGMKKKHGDLSEYENCLTPEERAGIINIEYHEFRKYKNMKESVYDYCMRIRFNKYYTDVYKLLKKYCETENKYILEQAINELGKIYASDSKYGSKIIDIIERNDLRKYMWL